MKISLSDLSLLEKYCTFYSLEQRQNEARTRILFQEGEVANKNLDLTAKPSDHLPMSVGNALRDVKSLFNNTSTHIDQHAIETLRTVGETYQQALVSVLRKAVPANDEHRVWLKNKHQSLQATHKRFITLIDDIESFYVISQPQQPQPVDEIVANVPECEACRSKMKL